MAKKSICFYSPYSGGANISGTRVRLEMLSRQLSAHDIEVHVVGPFLDIEGAKVHFFSLDLPVFLRPLHSLKAQRIISQINASVLVLEGPLFSLGMISKNVFTMIHDAKFATAYRRRLGFLLKLYYFIACRLSGNVLTVSNAERERIVNSLRLRPDRVQVSYNGIDEIWLKREKRVASKQFDLLYVSNFAPHKGHMRLLKCLRNSRLRIAFVGCDLGSKERVLAYSKTLGVDASFYNNLSTEDLIDLYDVSRVFVFPSQLEGFGIPFLEARARDLPVVASDIPVFRELASTIGGSLVDFNDREAVLSSITKSLSEPVSRADLTEFLWSTIADRLIGKFFR